jgi:hypothetical protein
LQKVAEEGKPVYNWRAAAAAAPADLAHIY